MLAARRSSRRPPAAPRLTGPVLTEALDYARAGDVLVVWRLELARLLDKALNPVLSADDQTAIRSIVMTATAPERGRVYQAGRDQYHIER